MPIYLISDYHFGDDCIRKSLRDFENTEIMDETMLENAKEIVSTQDTFVFLGDIIGKDGTESQAWESQSNLPTIDHWVVGNHDPFNASNYDSSYLPLNRKWRTSHRGYNFVGRHRPGNLPEFNSANEWGIYGHKHNNHKDTHPFLDQSKQRVNVSASLMNYKPISLDRIVDLIETGDSFTTRPDKI